MNRLLSRLLPSHPALAALAAPAMDAADAAAECALRGADAPATTAFATAAAMAERPAGCGWFESSRELRQGVAVQEWPAADWAVAALYFAALQPSSARLQ
jgi:hypothetical protein